MPEPAGSKAKFEGGTISEKVTHSFEPPEIWRPLRGRQIFRGSKDCVTFLEIVPPSNFAFEPAGSGIFVTPFWRMFHLQQLTVPANIDVCLMSVCQ